ncbi:gelsolin-like protein 2 [Pocillopora verrucosa]|uniref:gelsolin-like protein 2 n=1 Tax=Pocillopora verrucosa TaxID=203993 RepID=UPI0027970808|nr:gelsolin-like protein 2 [Pocillopora verrucosa]
MSGLVKAKKYDWKDSNLALFGSDTEKNVKKEAAAGEKAWEGAGEKPGLEIWRIVKFKVTDWQKEDHGKFFDGDSYIILNTYKDKESDELLYDVHFWIGKHSTQDEYGTAAYKTVELDTLLNDKPIQHREVQNHESELFKSYFKELQTLDGGADSGFRRVGPKEYKPRLLKVNDEGRNKVRITEVTYCKESITPDNVYIIDNGLEIVQINGTNCDKDEKFAAVQHIQKLKSERGGNVKTETKEGGYGGLPSGVPDTEEPGDEDFEPTIKKISDASGHLQITDTSGFSKSVLDSKDVFVVDNGKECFVWVGNGASVDERRKGMEYAHNYLMKTNHPLVPVSVVKEGQKCPKFDALF